MNEVYVQVYLHEVYVYERETQPAAELDAWGMCVAYGMVKAE